MTKRNKHVMGVFRDRMDAEAVAASLVERGYRGTDIHVMMSDEMRTRYYPEGKDEENPVGSQAAEGAGVGGAVGSVIGAALAAVATTEATVIVPGLGVAVAGIWATALAGAGAGAVTGGLLGALIGAGISESNAKAYETALTEGGIVLGVEPRKKDSERDLRKLFEEHNGENVIYE